MAHNYTRDCQFKVFVKDFVRCDTFSPLCLFSDSVVRIFTTAPERAADEEIQKTYEAEVAASSIPAQIGDIKTEQLSGPEALLNPGTIQTKSFILYWNHL